MTTNPFAQFLAEGLEYKDLEGMLKSELHIDEFASKLGEDDDIIVVSFFVRDESAAKDLMRWFESGYDYIIDADVSPGEIKPGRYLVYIEIRRRSMAGEHIQELLDDLNTLTEFQPEDWTMVYEGKETPWSVAAFNSQVPLSPKEYRKLHDADLNEMRVVAGLPTKAIYERDEAIRAFQQAAGIKI